MSRPININSKGEEIALNAKRYRIYILGGWGINLGQFSISIRNKETDEIIKCKRAFWPVHAYAFNKRAKRIFIINVPKSAKYEIIFKNQKTLKVKSSNLLISSMFMNSLPQENLEILITEKFGFYPILE